MWVDPPGGGEPVCRFWSGQSFAPLSSNFYTPYPGECSGLQSSAVWLFEGTVFDLLLPGSRDGACPRDSQPLFRAYNNGISGAPNHRYTTDRALLDKMVQQGWTMEGHGSTSVFACVPLQEWDAPLHVRCVDTDAGFDAARTVTRGRQRVGT